jgi:hypothetical protein
MNNFYKKVITKGIGRLEPICISPNGDTIIELNRTMSIDSAEMGLTPNNASKN